MTKEAVFFTPEQEAPVDSEVYLTTKEQRLVGVLGEIATSLSAWRIARSDSLVDTDESNPFSEEAELRGAARLFGEELSALRKQMAERGLESAA